MIQARIHRGLIPFVIGLGGALVGCTDDSGGLQDVGLLAADTGPDAPDSGGPIDAGPPDLGISVDGGDEPIDAGEPDGGEMDTGIVPCTVADAVVFSPVDRLVLVPDATGLASALLEVRYQGCEDVELQSLRLTGNPMSVDDFSVDDCDGNPCNLGISLCGADNPFCGPGLDTTILTVRYLNNDRTMPDQAVLAIETNVTAISTSTITLIGGL